MNQKPLYKKNGENVYNDMYLTNYPDYVTQSFMGAMIDCTQVLKKVGGDLTCNHCKKEIELKVGNLNINETRTKFIASGKCEHCDKYLYKLQFYPNVIVTQNKNLYKNYIKDLEELDEKYKID
jgi:hypothetical protein